MSKVKYTKEQLFAMDAIEVYKLVLKGDSLKIFPKGFWQRPEAEQNAIKCIKYLIENILKWNDSDFKNNFSYQIFKDNNLATMLAKVFNNSPFLAINTVYPDRFKEWELPSTPKGFWNKENGIKATKWLIEEVLNWSDEDVRNTLYAKTFKDNNLKRYD